MSSWFLCESVKIYGIALSECFKEPEYTHTKKRPQQKEQKGVPLAKNDLFIRDTGVMVDILQTPASRFLLTGVFTVRLV